MAGVDAARRLGPKLWRPSNNSGWRTGDAAKQRDLRGADRRSALLVHLAVFRRLASPRPRRRRRRRPDAGRHRHSLADGDRSSRQLHASDRLACSDRCRDWICLLRRQPAPFSRRGFDHRAHFRWRAGCACRGGTGPLRHGSGGAEPSGRVHPHLRRRAQARLHRRPFVHSGDDRLFHRHRGPYSGLSGARRCSASNRVRVRSRNRPCPSSRELRRPIPGPWSSAWECSRSCSRANA